MGKEINLPCGRFPNNLYNYLDLKKAEHNFPLLNWGYTWWLTTKEYIMERGLKRVTSQLRNKTKLPQSGSIRWSRSKTSVKSDGIIPWCDVMKMALYLYDLPPENVEHINHKKQSQCRDIPQNIWSLVLKTVKCHQK